MTIKKLLLSVSESVTNIFSQEKLLRNESKETRKYINNVITEKNYRNMFPCAVAAIVITAMFVISDIMTGLYEERWPYSILNIAAEILHGLAGIVFLLSLLDKKAKAGDLKRQHFYYTLFLIKGTVGFSLYSLADALKENTTSTHYFALMLLAVIPVLSAKEFVTYYFVVYAAPSVICDFIMGSMDVLTVVIYLSACLLHSILKTNYTRAELNRMYFVRLSKEMTEMSMTDPLTQVGNRERFYNYMRANTERWLNAGVEMCLVMIDIDKFKNFNDTYSHLKGDECLVKVAKTIASTLDSTVDNDKIFIRYGGEEFMFLIAGFNVEGSLLNAYPKIRSHIKDLQLPAGKGVSSKYVTISMGAHIFHYTEDTLIETELNKADMQLYMTKTNGRDGLGLKNHIYRDDMKSPVYIEEKASSADNLIAI